MSNKSIYKTFSIRILITCLIYSLILYSFGMIVNGSAESYWAIMSNSGYIKATLNNSRPIHAFFALLLGNISRHSVVLAYYVSYILSLFFLLLAEYRFGVLLYSICYKSICVKSETWREIIVGSLSCITIANLFSIEYFLWPEIGPMWVLPIWLCVEAVISFTKYMTECSSKHLFCSFVLLVVSAFAYQIILAVFIVLSLLPILIYSPDFKVFLKRQVIAGFEYTIAIILNLLFGKIVINSTRVGKTVQSISSAVSESTPIGTTTSQYIFDRIPLGMWIYALLCLILAVYLVICVIKEKEIKEVYKGLYISFVVVFIGIMPYVLKFTSDYKPRTHYPLGMLLGMLLSYGYLKGYVVLDKSERTSKIGAKYWICTAILALGIVSQYYSFLQIYYERYLTNADDKSLSMLYEDIIEEYEEEKGCTVKNVSFYTDAHIQKYIFNKGWGISIRGYGYYYPRHVLNFYTGNNYGIGETDDDIEKFFSNNDWNSYSSEQVIIVDDTVHICKY